ncbi:hypothetical protein HID58_095751 [Brassica napus]|uniref:DUF7870 domain-containing protein n=1 Tax=Brassica napus TaxID=3708 RepID=A0ABQ7X4V0_BRANA|nr:hypothetical protein HID58_092262 [Brassica napus]KAH0850125.1 hypothetical protein HID58_095751 [Brassica napus]
MDIKFTHGFPLNPAAIAAESSQHHLNLLASASSVATTNAVTASNINTASVDFSSVYTAAAAPINSFINPGTSFFTSPKGRQSSSQLKRAQERECIIPNRLEPKNMGMKEWLKENVKEEEYVVMKTEVEVLEEMVRSKTIKWWISFAWNASQWVLGLRGRNMETDVKEDIYQTMRFFSLHYLLFFLPFCCQNCFNHVMIILYCCDF